jgi:hypothetical protein
VNRCNIINHRYSIYVYIPLFSSPTFWVGGIDKGREESIEEEDRMLEGRVKSKDNQWNTKYEEYPLRIY